MDRRLQWAITRILEKIHIKFFGDVTITFQNGKVHTVKFIETETAPKEGV